MSTLNFAATSEIWRDTSDIVDRPGISTDGPIRNNLRRGDYELIAASERTNGRTDKRNRFDDTSYY